MRRWALALSLLLSLTCVLPVAWSLSLSGGAGSFPTVTCPDVGGNHLNFTGGIWTCGTSSSGGAPGNAKADSTTKGVATFTAEFTDNGSGLIGLNTALSSHTFNNTNTFTLRDDRLTLQDDGDTTRQARFQLNTITAGQTRVYTLPNFDGTFATVAGIETLTNKTLSGASNTVTNLPETALALTDVTTANASTGAHGLLPKLPGGTTLFLRGDGTYAAPTIATTPFSGLTSATNTTAALVVGTGASLSASGTGTIAATTSVSWASLPTACAPNLYAIGQGFTGNLTCQQVAFTQLGGTIADAQLSSVTAGGTCTNCTLTVDVKGRVTALATGSGGGSSAFAALTSGTNTTAVMVVGSGASLSATGTGTLAATTALALAADPAACPASQFVTDVAAAGTLTCVQPALATLSDGASVVTLTGVQKVTNKQFVPRWVSPTVVANAITVSVDSTDVAYLNAITAGLTINAPTGTGGNPTQGQELTFRLKSATPQSLTWNAIFTAENGIALPTTTTGDGTTYDWVKFVYNADSAKWGTLASSKGVQRGITTLASSTTFACNGDIASACEMQMTGATGTLIMGAPTGTPVNGQELLLRLMCTNSQTFAWNATFLASPGVPLPTYCQANVTQWLQARVIYSSALTKWQVSQLTLIDPVMTTLTSSTTYTCPALSNHAACEMAMTGATGTLTVAAPTGTPVNGQQLALRFLCTNSQTFAWNAIFIDGATQARPTTCPADTTKWLEVRYTYSSVLTKWGMVLGGVTGGSSSFTVTKNLPVTGVKLPTTNPARIDRSETNDRLLFDATTSQCAYWQFYWPSDYTSGGTFKLLYTMTSATTGSVNFDIAVMAVSSGDAVDINTESYDTANACNDATVPGTAGFLKAITCTLTNKDSVAASDLAKLRLCRNIADTATGDAEVETAELSYVH